MDHMIYTAASGARQALAQQAVTANNLANVSTTGFKAQLSISRADPVNGPGWPTRVLAAQVTPGTDVSGGPIIHTGRDLDVAVKGSGWLAVQTPDGGEAYTRDGSFQVDSTGVLRSGGLPVVDESGKPLVIPLGARVMIADDGTISVLESGMNPTAITQVGQLKLVDPQADAMYRGDDGLFYREQPAGAAGVAPPFPANPDVRVVSGALEGSNVSATEAMVSMIANARHFEMQMKAISTADQNARQANTILSIT